MIRQILRGLRDHDESGFTLVELALSVAMIAVLLGVITLGASSIGGSRLSAAEQDLMTLYHASTTWASQQATPTYAGISLAALQTAGLVPSSITGNNPWGNAYTLSGTSTSLTITTNVGSATSCTTLQGRFAVRAGAATCTGTPAETLTVTF